MMRSRRILLAVVLFTSLACGRAVDGFDGTQPGAQAALGGTATAYVPPGIPAEYRSLYDELEADLDAYLATLPKATGQRPPSYAAELLYANGNVGTALLQPGVLNLVRHMLDSLQAIGVQAVGVQISYPLLLPDFPRSEDYLQFYRQISQEVRQRGMTLLVESGPVFPDPEASGDFGKQVDYSGLTVESYFRTKQEMLVTIARVIQPDYLAFGSEPDTEQMLTGLDFTPHRYFTFVDATLAEIDPAWGVKVGAGAGTWEEGTYLDHFLEHPGLDFVDVHIYPLGRNGALLEEARRVASRAEAVGKEVVIGECWLYKASHAELTGGLGGEYIKIYSRDAFRFWEPLDEKFMQAVVRMAAAEGIDLVSFFWTRYFYAYLDYETSAELTTLERSTLAARTARISMQTGQWSPLGLFYRGLIEATP